METNLTEVPPIQIRYPDLENLDPNKIAGSIEAAVVELFQRRDGAIPHDVRMAVWFLLAAHSFHTHMVWEAEWDYGNKLRVEDWAKVHDIVDEMSLTYDSLRPGKRKIEDMG